VGNILAKDILVTVLDPGKPATPGSPGSPGSPAWDEVVDYTTIGILYWQIVWKDASNNEHISNVPPESMPPADATIISETPVFGPIHVHEVIHHDAVPPTPPTPGTPGTPPVLSQNYQLGWNCSADSIDPIPANGMYQFSVPVNVAGVFTGLAHDGTAVGTHYERITYALYFNAGSVQVYEANTPATAPVSYVASDVFTIRRVGAEIAYYQNSTLLRVSTTPSSGQLRTYAALYEGGDEIVDAVISQTVDVGFYAETSGQLSTVSGQPFVLFSETDGLLRTIYGAGAVYFDQGATLSVTGPEPLVRFMGPDVGILSVEGPGYVINLGENVGLVPNYGLFGTVSLEPQVFMYGGPVPSWIVHGPTPGTFFAGSDGAWVVRGPAPEILLGEPGNTIFATAPRPRAFIVGDILPEYYSLGIHAKAPHPTALLYGGATISAKAPRPTASLTGDNSYGIIKAKAPRPVAYITALVGDIGIVVATAPKPTAQIYGGVTIAATAPAPTATITATLGIVGTITATAPSPRAAVTAVVGIAVAINATAPRPQALAWNLITATAPRPRFYIDASNEAAYTVTDAYVVTLNNPAKPVTRYTNYPFQSIVRFGNDYLMFGPSGVFKLGGADDAGTPIAWSFKFGQTTETPGDEFGQGYKKTNLGVYFDGRFTGTAQLSVSVDDGTVYTYSKLMPDNKRDTLRFVPGKGLRGFAWQFGLSGAGPLDVYRAEFLQHALARKVKHG